MKEQDDVLSAARHYFDKGRCSNHQQYNGRYCRDAGPWQRWCIHCAGLRLLERAESAESARDDLIKERDFQAMRRRDQSVSEVMRLSGIVTDLRAQLTTAQASLELRCREVASFDAAPSRSNPSS